jgi:8-oxo-dGTP diphosphatase
MGRLDQGVSSVTPRYSLIPRTLCFITHGDDVLLLRGASNKRLWAGKYNGVGGHVERGEDIYHSVQREVREETGLSVADCRLRVVATIDAGDPRQGVLILVFSARAPHRQTDPSAEGTLEWWPRTRLPTENMVEDLPLLLPRVLAMAPDATPLFAAYHYDSSDRLQVTFADQ